MEAKFSRVDPRAGFVRGKVTACRECGGELPGKARTFCSNECVDSWKIRSQPSFAAELVLKRDAGVCVVCRLDCIGLLSELKRMRAEDWERRGFGPRVPDAYILSFERDGDHPFAVRMRELGLKRLDRRLWHMDHILPVAEGGGSCGLDNLRTLCCWCHKRETAELRKRLAAKRKIGNGGAK